MAVGPGRIHDWSADSLVRALPASDTIRADKAVRAPVSSFLESTIRWATAFTMYLFSVAQIFNLPYRRFVIGRTQLAGGSWQVKNLRYGRLQVCATGAAGTLNTYFTIVLTGVQSRRPEKSGSHS